MQKRREVRGRRGPISRGMRYFSRGIGLFKLAAGLVAIASVLFLVPGLRLLVPGLQNIGTVKVQAMPAKDYQEQEKAPARPVSSDSDDVQAHRALNFAEENELGLSFVFQDTSNLGVSTYTTGPGSSASEIMDVGDELLDPQALAENFEDSGYKEPSVTNLGLGLNGNLAEGLSR